MIIHRRFSEQVRSCRPNESVITGAVKPGGFKIVDRNLDLPNGLVDDDPMDDRAESGVLD